MLKQKPGEATVKVGATFQPADGSQGLAAANGAQFNFDRSLGAQLGIYKMKSAEPVSEAASNEAINSLNQDGNIEYAYPVYVNAATGKRHFLNDEVVVRLKARLEPAQTADLLSRFKLAAIDTLSVEENIYVFRLTEPKSFNPFRVCHALRERPEVLWAEPNMAQEIQPLLIPNDPSFGDQWHLRNTGQTQAFSDADVDADEAWDGSQSYGSSGVRIAIVDDGVETTHADLAGNIVQGYDFFGNDSNPNPNHNNDNHGTSVAGIAAAVVNNSTGVAGAAGRCRILPVRIAGGQVTCYEHLPGLGLCGGHQMINCSWIIS